MQVKKLGDIVEIAQDHILFGKRQKEIAAERDLHQTTVSRYLQEAEETGVIRKSVDPAAIWTAPKDDALEYKLRERFQLREAIVVNCRKNPELSDSYEKLHYALANEAARRAKHEIKDDSHLALGTGGSVTRYAEVLSFDPPRANKVHVSPLGGRLWIGELALVSRDGLQFEYPREADYSALILARAMNLHKRKKIWVSQVSHIMHTETPALAQKTMRERCVFLPGGKWNWGLLPPHRAVLGVAPIVEDESGGESDTRNPHSSSLISRYLRGNSYPWKDLQKELDRAITIAQKAGLGISSLATRLFPTLPILTDETRLIGRDHIQAIRHITPHLRKLNARNLSPDWPHFQSITRAKGGISQVIGGTPLKYDTLWTLLLAKNFGNVLINSLCTDYDSATRLSEALRLFETRASSQHDLYREAIEACFDC